LTKNLIFKNKNMIKKRKGYSVLDREDFIEDLIKWIAETKNDNDKFLMKEDLKMLLSWNCKYIYSSESTNEYIEIKN